MMGMVCLMLKRLKRLFIYTEPEHKSEEFRFPEDPSESSKWGQFAGYEKKSRDEEKNNTNNDEEQAVSNIINTIKKSSQSFDYKEYQANQTNVYNKLSSILKTSQESSSYGENQSEKNDKNNKQENSDNYKSEPEDENSSIRILRPKRIEELVKNKNINKDSKIKRADEDGREHKNSVNIENNKKETENIRTIDITSDFKICESNEDNKDAKNSKNNKEDSNTGEKKNGGDAKNETDKNKKGIKLKYVSKSLDENIGFLESFYNIPVNKDLIIKKFNIAKRIPACLVYVDGMIDKLIVTQFALPQLMDEHAFRHYDFECDCPLDYIEKNVLTIHQMCRMNSYEEINPQIVSGLAVLFIDGCDECLVMESRGFERRGIAPPATETVINGPQEGFTETLRTNITQVRRIVKSENLITEFEFISKKNNFLCAIMYMEGIANPRIVEEVKRRVKNLDVDYISGSGMLEQLIEDKPYMIFPQIVSTERPDRAASFLMEGKVIIICEGTPFALAMPIVFFDLFHTSEESNLRWQYATFLRIIRLMGLLLATFLPGMYTALILFHQEMIPTSLLSSIVATRVNVPFPTLVEILLMEFSFELIREGGIRVPGVTGNTLGIIGALILGQAAVEAGLVSPILIIIVAVSGLGNFSIPNYSLSLAIRIIRISFIIFGQIAGFFGISVAFTILCAFALSMKSFGVPFFSPVAPATRSNADKVVRAPYYEHVWRPDWLNTQDERRMGDKARGWKPDIGGAQR